ncbi:MAG: SDR family NAD(P)-dependent oxidoreductase [Microbacteriaceae bacterium]|nr:SDR family NAD(P)-dependent oxidoreductase [Microbacteriaceae bacterium]
MNISGCVALVTGGASGLGLATARALQASGATVVIVDRADSPGAEVAAGHDFTFAAADVTDEAQLDAAINVAVGLSNAGSGKSSLSNTGPSNDGFGGFRIAVSCAGIATPGRVLGRNGPLPLATFDEVIRVNLSGTFNLIRLAAAAMQRLNPETANGTLGEERGVIVTTASIAAFDGQIGQAAYAASKAGVAGMTLPIARELARDLIRVVCIAPGLFDTPLLAALPEDARASLGAQVPHPARLGRPAEFAALVEHIVHNPMLNGETIRLDGAIRMGPR